MKVLFHVTVAMEYFVRYGLFGTVVTKGVCFAVHIRYIDAVR